VGTYVALSKPLTAVFPVFLLASLRFGIAAVVMLPWLRASASDQPINAATAGTLFWQSLFGNFLFSICMLFGVSMTSASSSGLILSSLPAVVALLSWFWLRERLSARVWSAVALAILGIGLLTVLRTHQSAGAVPTDDSIAGNFLVLGCVVCEAIYVILGKRLTASLSAKRISALINLIGLALMLPFGVVQARSFDFAAVSGSMWLLLLFYSVAASMVATWLWLTGLRSVPASHSGVFTIALPLAACVVGVTWLGEHFTTPHALAFVCALTGVVLIATTPRPAPRLTRSPP
jgi:drug/metabolite transporter (DMT)-like permease